MLYNAYIKFVTNKKNLYKWILLSLFFPKANAKIEVGTCSNINNVHVQVVIRKFAPKSAI